MVTMNQVVLPIPRQGKTDIWPFLETVKILNDLINLQRNFFQEPTSTQRKLYRQKSTREA